MDWKHTVMDLMHQGGWVMWALLALSIFSLGTAIERALALRRAGAEPARLLAKLHDALLRRRSVDHGLKLCAAATGPVARVAEAGLKRFSRSSAQLEKRNRAPGPAWRSSMRDDERLHRHVHRRYGHGRTPARRSV